MLRLSPATRTLTDLLADFKYEVASGLIGLEALVIYIIVAKIQNRSESAIVIASE